jgi:hypothetical protein
MRVQPKAAGCFAAVDEVFETVIVDQHRSRGWDRDHGAEARSNRLIDPFQRRSHRPYRHERGRRKYIDAPADSRSGVIRRHGQSFQMRDADVRHVSQENEYACCFLFQRPRKSEAKRIVLPARRFEIDHQIKAEIAKQLVKDRFMLRHDRNAADERDTSGSLGSMRRQWLSAEGGEQFVAQTKPLRKTGAEQDGNSFLQRVQGRVAR